MHEIIPRLFLGSSSAGASLENLQQSQITHVVSLGNFEAIHDSITYKIINVLDVEEENLIQYFNETFEFIDEARAAKQRVLVHCEAGVSRSTTIVAAYMMRKGKLDVQKTLDMIRDRRAFVAPNDGFLDQLELYHTLEYDVDPKHSAYRRFLVDSNAKEQQETGYISNLALTPDPEVHRSTTSQKLIRCKKCRRRLVEVEHVLEHAPGKGQLAFSYTKRNGELNVTSAPTATMATNQPLNPLLASLAASRMQCSSYFIEPMEWMGNLLDGEVEGRIDCPKCMSKLGQYNWAGAQCSCGRWITPAFMLHRKQVDEMRNQLPTSSSRP
ncbi:dual specificity protein phosphatase 12 [Lichtheimia corymbifera JMRC:FSU:9682]|uniref:protein-tyrosine-phosphatase n=1 Tax=Lichtheimia corymbifera JMRC:FSU:9682 TaxID=1263082 RepID=A0A068SDR3_9FUNG|nr:dual specificity protein phosphatase 12 [Lichtheimia corymbifera JMRC:FSU:9682]